MVPPTFWLALALSLISVKAGIITQYNLVPPQQSALGTPQIFQHSITPGIILAPQSDTQSLAHPAVVQNAIAESQLPADLINPFYKNPAVASGLAKESWFTDKEFPVHHREAEKISRSQIYKIISQLRSV